MAAVDGAKTSYQVAAEIPWNTKGMPWQQLPALHKRGAVLETLAHLERLHGEGMLGKDLIGGVFCYRLR